ncbi:MAG TPA: porin, partial [Saprospiraceae bacterium]|nr:porin [Saprospiraceae bacterium]
MKNLIVLTISAFLLMPSFMNAQACMSPTSDEGISIIGFIQPQYEYLFAGQDQQGKRLDESSFYFNRARLGVTGNIPYDFSYYFMTEISPTLNGAKNIQPPLLLDAFISYNRFAPYVKVSAGQFKVPFGIELPQPCHKLYTINRSMVVANLVDPWRDLGVMVSGGTGDLSILGTKTKNAVSYS